MVAKPKNTKIPIKIINKNSRKIRNPSNKKARLYQKIIVFFIKKTYFYYKILYSYKNFITKRKKRIILFDFNCPFKRAINL